MVTRRQPDSRSLLTLSAGISAGVAQQAEQLICNQQVADSISVISSIEVSCETNSPHQVIAELCLSQWIERLKRIKDVIYPSVAKWLKADGLYPSITSGVQILPLGPEISSGSSDSRAPD